MGFSNFTKNTSKVKTCPKGEKAPNLASLLGRPGTKYQSILTKNGLGNILGDFFTSPS
jgi:hypothetical protein